MKDVPVVEPVTIETVWRLFAEPCWRMIVTAVPSPPVHFRVVGLPATTEVGTVVKASLVVCAMVATAKEAQTRRALVKYMSTVLMLI